MRSRARNHTIHTKDRAVVASALKTHSKQMTSNQQQQQKKKKEENGHFEKINEEKDEILWKQQHKKERALNHHAIAPNVYVYQDKERESSEKKKTEK